MKYTLKINHKVTIEADNETEAYEKFWEQLERNNETAETFLTDIMEVTK